MAEVIDQELKVFGLDSILRLGWIGWLSRGDIRGGAFSKCSGFGLDIRRLLRSNILLSGF